MIKGHAKFKYTSEKKGLPVNCKHPVICRESKAVGVIV